MTMRSMPATFKYAQSWSVQRVLTPLISRNICNRFPNYLEAAVALPDEGRGGPCEMHLAVAPAARDPIQIEFPIRPFSVATVA
jgi:hypothetical protein